MVMHISPGTQAAPSRRRGAAKCLFRMPPLTAARTRPVAGLCHDLGSAAPLRVTDSSPDFDCAIDPAAPAMLEAMAEDLRVNGWLVIPAGELHERFSRSSGPGGQSVNTTDSRVELSFDVRRSPSLPEHARERAVARLASRLTDGVLTVASAQERSQLLNRAAARERLADLLREAVAPPPRPRVPTKPSRGARERRLQGKRRRAETKRNRRYEGGE
jgi:ribosome-associated protein